MSDDLRVVLFCEAWIPCCLSGFLIKMTPSSFFPALSLPFHHGVIPQKRGLPAIDPLTSNVPGVRTMRNEFLFFTN